MSGFRIRYRDRVVTVRSGRTVIGRSTRADVVVDNKQASREHAMLHAHEGRLVISDMKSRNGTFVNSQLVARPRVLHDGDVIQIGGDSLEVLRAAPTHVTMTESLGDAGGFGDEEEETTITLARTLELAEILIEAATDDRQRRSSVGAIARAVEDSLDGLGPAVLTDDDVARIRSVADTVVSWRQDGSLDEWRRQIEARVRRRLNPSAPPP